MTHVLPVVMLFPYLYPPIYPCWSLLITIPIIKRSASFRKHGLVISLGYSQRIDVVWGKHAFLSLLFRYSSFVRTSEQDDDQGATAAPIDSLYLNLLCPSPSLSLALALSLYLSFSLSPSPSPSPSHSSPKIFEERVCRGEREWISRVADREFLASVHSFWKGRKGRSSLIPDRLTETTKKIHLCRV